MESDPNRPPAPRKVRFAPKPPPRRPQKPSPQPKCEVPNKDNAVDEKNEQILGKEVNETLDSSDDEYKEPWDYENIDYPITLPLRRPNSGDPDILDEEEFGAKATSMVYDENTIKHAALKLRLRPEDECNDRRMIFFQLPGKLPFHRETPTPRPNVVEDDPSRVAGSSASGGTDMSSNRSGGDFGSLPGGCMGKLMVYKSGAVKWKMGDHLFDVSHGASCKFQQDVVAINEAKEHCVALGRIEECGTIVTPDLDSLLKKD